MYVTHNEIIGGPEHKPFLLKYTRVAEASDAVDMAALAALEDAQIDGEQDLIVELIDLYLEDTSVKLSAIREAIAVIDEESLKRATHSLRGSSASLGAHRTAALCWELEHLGFSGSLESVESLRAELEQECELVRQVLADERRIRAHATSHVATWA